MNYYKRHIGDYAKKAGHLSVLEHGVYTLLLDAYYDRELAPTRAEALRQARARTTEEVAAVDAVLADFFTLADGRYRQARVEEEFVKAEEIAKLNAAKGKLGGRPRKPKGNPEETRRLSVAKPNESPEKPNPLIHQLSTAEARAGRASRLPPNWEPGPILLAYCREQRPDLDAETETENFRDYWTAKAGRDALKLDWPATFRRWVRSAHGTSRPTGPPRQRTQSNGNSGLHTILAGTHHAPDTRTDLVLDADSRGLGDALHAEPRRLPGG